MSDFLSEHTPVLLEETSCDEPISDFASRSWHLPRFCLADRSALHYLSYYELLCLAACARVSAAVFTVSECEAQLVGDHVGDGLGPNGNPEELFQQGSGHNETTMEASLLL